MPICDSSDNLYRSTEIVVEIKISISICVVKFNPYSEFISPLFHVERRVDFGLQLVDLDN